MLHALCEYARSRGLYAEPGFKTKEIRWLLTFNARGRFLGTIRQGERKAGRQLERCPDLSHPEIKAGGPGCRHFLVDTLDIVALFTKDGTADAKLVGKHDFFVKLLEQAGAVMPPLAAIAATLRDEATLAKIREDLARKTPKPGSNDRATFAIDDPSYDDEPILVKSDRWHDWWRSFRATLGAKRQGKKGNVPRRSQAAAPDASRRMLCLLSGELVVPTPTHPKITGLSDVGGISAGDALASFKQESFCSYGLVQAANAAMSEEMATVYATALNDLLRRRSVRLAGAKVVYWYGGKEDIPGEMNPLAKILGQIDFGDEPQAAEDRPEPSDDVRTVAQAEHRGRSILEAIKTGKREELLDYRFCAMTLSGNSGRVVVRHWMDGRFEDLTRSVDAWFGDLSIQNISGRRLTDSPKFERVVTCLLPEKPVGQTYDDWVKPVGWAREALWSCALSGQSVSVPEAVVRCALLRERQAMLNGEIAAALDRSGDKHALRLASWYVRCALLKTFLIRKGDVNVEPYLNKDHPHPAYHAGRMLAVFQQIQAVALGEPKASYLDRYYASASLTPAQTIPRVWNLARHHLRGIRDEKLREKVLALLTEIHGKLKDTMPPLLGLREQSLFQLGFFQQQPFLPRSRRDQSDTDSGNEDAHS